MKLFYFFFFIFLLIFTSCMSLILPTGNIRKGDYNPKQIDSILVYNPVALILIENNENISNADSALEKIVRINLKDGVDEYLKIPHKYCILDDDEQKNLDTILMQYMLILKDEKNLKKFKVPPEVLNTLEYNKLNYAMIIGSISWTNTKKPAKYESSIGVAMASSHVYCILFERKNKSIIFYGDDIKHNTDPTFKDYTDEQIKKMIDNIIE